jgi:hypothetical protein
MDLTLLDDMDDIFLASGFEEEVAYTPDGGTASPIKAIVERTAISTPTSRESTRADQRRYEVAIYVSRSDVSIVTPRADTVTLYRRNGDANTTVMSVAGVISSDAGSFYLGLS